MNEPLSVQTIRDTINLIASEEGDDEKQHTYRDDLLVDVLTAIAEGAENPEELAQEALRVEELDFEKWCA